MPAAQESRLAPGGLGFEGDLGVLCVEAGGLHPASAAPAGIIAAFDRLEELDAYRRLKPDLVLFDVLGDVALA